MRDFNFGESNSADISAANVAGLQANDLTANELPAETLRLDAAEREAVREDAESTFRRTSMQDDNDESGNIAKIAGGVLAALLLIGGSIYAYEATVANHAPQAVASAPAKQQTVAAAQPVAPPSTPDANVPDTSAPSASNTPPVVSAPKQAAPARGVARADATPAASTPDSSSTAITNAAPATSTASADPGINAPMTLTPETAPPPQQSAMQQPITAPNVSGQPSQPTSEVANNNANSVMLPSGSTVQPNLTAPAAPSDTATPATAPSESSPATPAPTPAQ